MQVHSSFGLLLILRFQKARVEDPDLFIVEVFLFFSQSAHFTSQSSELIANIQ